MFEITGPQNDPLLQSAEMREVIWALELAASPELSSGQIDAIWMDVRRRAVVRPGIETIEAARRIWGGMVRGLREVVAVLNTESLAPATAVRSAGASLPRLMVYETDSYAISLSFSGAPESARLTMIGQVIPKAADSIPSGGRVAVWSAQGNSFAEVSEYGEFTVNNVPRGSLHMDLLLGDDSVQLSPIETNAVQTMEE